MISVTIVIMALIALICQVQASFEPVQVMCEVNGKMVPAIVDTGAEISVMSTSCARRCGLWQSIDTQHSGRAIGVGTSDIVGGIEGLGIRIGPLSFQNKISILRNSNHRCDFIIGLDILKRFNCDILLRERVVKMYVRGNEVRIPLVQADGTSVSVTDLSGHYQTFAKQQAQSKDSATVSSSPLTQTSSTSMGSSSSSTTSTTAGVGRHPAAPVLLDEEEDEEFEDDNEYDTYMSQRHVPIGVSTASSASSEVPSLPSRRVEYVVNRHCYDHNTDGRGGSDSRIGGFGATRGSPSNSRRSSSSSSSTPFSSGFGGAGAASKWTQTRSPSATLTGSSNSNSRRPFVDPDLEKYMHREALRKQEKVLHSTGHATTRADRHDHHHEDGTIGGDLREVDGTFQDNDTRSFDEEDYDDNADDLREDEDYEQFHERHRDRSISMEGV